MRFAKIDIDKEKAWKTVRNVSGKGGYSEMGSIFNIYFH
jgi:hypothetical protein